MNGEYDDGLNPLVQSNRLKRLYIHTFHELLNRENLSRNELLVLLFLASNPKLNTAKDIVELQGLTKSHVCKSVEALTGRGLLESAPDPRDRRRIQLFPTAQAQPIITEGLAIQKRFFEMLYEGVTEEENEALKRVFQKIWRNAQRAMEQER